MKNSVAIIQARMGSARLPGKALLPIGDSTPVLKHVIDRVRLSRVERVVVATPETEADSAIWRACDAWGVECISWPDEFDVLQRFDAAMTQTMATTIVRITADCPLIDPIVIDAVLDEHSKGGADYTSNVQTRTFPDGYDVEVFTSRLLASVNERTGDTDARREHVLAQLLPVTCAQRYLRCGLGDLGFWRFTLDTWPDYFKIGDLMNQHGKLLSLDGVVRAVKAGKVRPN